MEVFAVFKEGVYRHECGGVFSTEAAALERAKELGLAEKDGYHTFEVVPFALDATGDEPDAIATVEFKGKTRYDKFYMCVTSHGETTTMPVPGT